MNSAEGGGGISDGIEGKNGGANRRGRRKNDSKGIAMRLWSLHPRYLDAKGLNALWREGLLARKVLANETRGYRNHPQLERFRSQPDPVASLDAYLHEVYGEAIRRGYRYASGKIASFSVQGSIPVTDGQLRYELGHLRRKLRLRDPLRFRSLCTVTEPEPHPLFHAVPGDIADWERVSKESSH